MKKLIKKEWVCPYFPKTSLKMKLTTLFLLVSLLHINASTYSQTTKLSIDAHNITVGEVFNQIESASEFRFLYESNQIDTNRTVSLKAKKKKINDILEMLFYQTNVAYKINDRQILLFQKKSLPVSITPQKVVTPTTKNQTHEVKGLVTDTNGQPLAGTNVIEKGTTNGAQTNFDGNFSLQVSNANAILVVSYLGFNTKEVSISGQTNITIALQENADELDEVIVVGYGTQTKESLTGAVSQISAEVLENRPVANLGQALQGVIPNLNISVSNGALNTTPSFNVRGGTSFALNSNNDKYEFNNGEPLILIDGVQGDINLLNPDDIESVTVLKDAASAAIYGARGAYGVMLVTTKKGRKNEKTQITYSNSIQWNSPSATPDLLDAYTIQLTNIKAEELEGRTPGSDMLEKLDRIEAYMNNPSEESIYYMDPGGNIIWIGNTDVYNEAVRKASPMVKHNLSLTGGSEKNSYYVSLGYLDQDGLYKLNTDNFKRYNALVNVGSKPTKWLSLDYGVQYNNSVFEEPVSPAGKGGWWTAMSQEPFRNINMPLRTPNYSPAPGMYTDNILSFMDYGSSNKERKELLILSIAPTINLLKNWDLKSSFAYKSYNNRRKQVIPILERIDTMWDQPIAHHTDPSSVQKWNTHTDQYTFNLWSDYKFSLGNHNFYAMAGFNQEWYIYDYLGGRGEQLLSPNIPTIGQTLGNEYSYDNESHWALRGGFYRITYNFNNKYFIGSNGRYDGTSRFPKDSRFKFFPSLSAGWRVSEEKFAEFLKPTVNELKFRASYGSLGNQNVANYIYIPSYGTILQVNHLFSGQRPMGVTPPGLVDPNLTWETATTIDFGLDLKLFNRLGLTFDWYNRETTDILVAGDKFPAVLGATAPTKNSGAMETKGWELSINWNDETKGGFKYNMAFTLSDYQSKITSFDGNPNNLLSGLYEGQVMGEIWGYETAGIFQTQNEIDNAPSQRLLNANWYPGDIRYQNLDDNAEEIGPGANTLEDSGDRKIIGNSTPRYQFGFNFNAVWKSFDFGVFFQGVAKRDYWIGSSMYWGKIAGGTGTWEVYNNSWTPEHTDAFYPAYKTKSANILTQTRYLQDASYIRLKDISLGYSIPNFVTDKINIDKLRVYASAYNIWEYSKVPEIFDPESMSANYPLLKSIAFGLQITF
ncbi:MAG: TonB-dependent receptor [Flavobacteriaceae bacterium]